MRGWFKSTKHKTVSAILVVIVTFNCLNSAYGCLLLNHSTNTKQSDKTGITNHCHPASDVSVVVSADSMPQHHTSLEYASGQMNPSSAHTQAHGDQPHSCITNCDNNCDQCHHVLYTSVSLYPQIFLLPSQLYLNGDLGVYKIFIGLVKPPPISFSS